AIPPCPILHRSSYRSRRSPGWRDASDKGSTPGVSARESFVASSPMVGAGRAGGSRWSALGATGHVFGFDSPADESPPPAEVLAVLGSSCTTSRVPGLSSVARTPCHPDGSVGPAQWKICFAS